jgi:hypothetical protein
VRENDGLQNIEYIIISRPCIYLFIFYICIGPVMPEPESDRDGGSSKGRVGGQREGERLTGSGRGRDRETGRRGGVGRKT